MMTNGSYDWDAFYNISFLQQSRNREDQERLNRLLYTFGNENGWKICASFLLRDESFNEIYKQANDINMKDFFCFRGIEEFIKTWYTTLQNNETTEQIHIFILKMMELYVSNKFDKKENFLRNKCIHIATRVAIIDYPTRWPSFFKDFIYIIHRSNDALFNKDFNCKIFTSGGIYAFELFFKFLISWDNEVGSREMQTNQFIERNTAIKDYMRDHDIVNIMETVVFVIRVAGENNTALLKKALKVTALYISWVDIRLIVSDPILDGIIKPLLSHTQFDNNTKSAALDCLLGIVNKGMSASHKLELIGFFYQKLDNNGIWGWLDFLKDIPDDLGHDDFGFDEDETDNCFLVTLGALINAFGLNLIDCYKSLRDEKSDECTRSMRMMYNKLRLAFTVARATNNIVAGTCLPFVQGFITLLKSIYKGDTKKARRVSLSKMSSQMNEEEEGIVNSCLSLLAHKLQYPAWYNFDKEEEPEGNFQTFRRNLLNILTNIIQLNDQIAMKYLLQLLDDTTKHLNVLSYQEIEVVLTMIYHLGEAVKSVKGDYFSADCDIGKTLKHAMQLLCSSDIGHHKNPEVRLVFFEIVFRYEKFFNYESGYLMGIIMLILSEHGLKSNELRVVTRCVYILSRLIKTHKSKFNNASSVAVLQEITSILQSSTINNAILTCDNQSTISAYSYLYETAANLSVTLDSIAADRRHQIFDSLIGPIIAHVPHLCAEWAAAAVLAVSSTDPMQHAHNPHNIKAAHIAQGLYSAATYINYTCRAFSGGSTAAQSMSGLNCLDVYMGSLDVFIAHLQSAFNIAKHPLAVGRAKINSGLRSLLHILCKSAQSDSSAIAAILQRLPHAIELFLSHLSVVDVHTVLPLCSELEEILPLFMQIVNAFKNQSIGFFKQSLWTLFSICDNAIKAATSEEIDYNSIDVSEAEVDEKVRQLRRLYLQLIGSDVQLIFGALSNDQVVELLSACIQMIHRVDRVDPVSVKLCVHLFHRVISLGPTLVHPDPQTRHLIVYQLVYKQLLPLMIYLPSCDKFNLADAQFHLTLVEMANCQRAMFLNGGTQFIQYLQSHCLPQLSFNADLILQYCQALNHNEKDYQTFLKNFYLQTKSK